MTAYVSLGKTEAEPLPAIPSFLSAGSDDTLADVVKAITKAKRIIVVSGAGISVKAGIPDFRSSNGLFNTLKRDNAKEGLSSGKDLFDASVFTSEQTASMFYQMIARLSDLSLKARPTAFHSLLRMLDTRGQLLRLYTQNIDALEEKAGLSFGVPSFEDRPRPKRPRLEAECIVEGSTMKAETLPKCIPLHGTLQNMHCSLCSHSVAMAPYVSILHSGAAPSCPACTSLEETRELVGKRLRGVGILRPSVVLYGEIHREGEGVGEVVRRDLVGKGTGKGKGNKGGDLLIVVGTSLRVPGTKRIVREFSKSVRMADAASGLTPPESCHLPSPAPSPRRTPVHSLSPAPDSKKPIRTVFINYDFPLPSREWDGVFDVWIKGDAQEFAQLVTEAIGVKELAAEKKKRGREAALLTPTSSSKKRKVGNGLSTPSKTGAKLKKDTKGKKRTSNSVSPTKLRKTKPKQASKNPRRAKSEPTPGLDLLATLAAEREYLEQRTSLSSLSSSLSPLSATSSLDSDSRSRTPTILADVLSCLSGAATPISTDSSELRDHRHLLPSPSPSPPPTPPTSSSVATSVRRSKRLTPEVVITRHRKTGR